MEKEYNMAGYMFSDRLKKFKCENFHKYFFNSLRERRNLKEITAGKNELYYSIYLLA